MFRLGELFVSLGFDVDDKKLKTFDETLKSAYSTAIKMVGIGGGVAGFIELAKGAEQTALQLANLTTVYGTSAKAAQAWGAAVHESNPLTSYAQGIESFGKIAGYFASAAFQGKGATALNRLGVQFTTDDVQHPERVIDRLFEKIPQLLAAHPENRGLYSALVGDITGDPTNLRIFEKGKGFEDAAGSRVSLYQKELDDTVKVAQDIAALQDQWDHFYKHIMASLAPGAGELAQAAEKGGFWGFVDKLGQLDPFGIKDKANATAGWFSGHQGAIDDALGGGRKDSMAFWAAHGYSQPQIAGWLAQEQAESSFNPRAKNGKYGGIFQWSPERAARILKGTGIDISKAGHWQQLQAAAWEFEQMGLDKNFRGIGDPRQASKYLSDKFEIHEKYNKQHGDEAAYRASLAAQAPNVTANITVNTHRDDPDHIGRVVAGHIDDTVLDTWLNQTGANP